MTESVYVALYKGPPKGIGRLLAHWATKAVMSLRDKKSCPWSHIEIYADGKCYSSSAMDVMTEGPRIGKRGGMRVKDMIPDTLHWDVYEVPMRPGLDKASVIARFRARQALSQGYDYPAGAYWALPLIHPRARADNCLEAVAGSVNHPNPSKVTFRGLLDYLAIRP